MSFEFLILTLQATVQSAIPILFATLGAIFNERAGVLNLGVEGMMIVGALAGFLAANATGDPWLGVLAAGSAAACMAGLHGLVCLVFRGSQVVSGLALTILGVGLANFLGNPFNQTRIAYAPEKIALFAPLPLPLLRDIPILGPILFNQDALVYLAYLAVPCVWFVLMRTRFGLALRAVGENPRAVPAAGLSPVRLRWAGVLLGGFFAGVGGSYLSLVVMRQWVPDITAGRGWIAVALVIFAFWRPGRAMAGALLFGGAWALQSRLQALDLGIPSDYLKMLPFVLTLLVLLFSSLGGRGRQAPKALGVNLEPGE